MDIVGAVQWFLGLGATVAIPIILFIVGLAFKIPASKAFRAALTIACGFVGINLVIGLLWGTMSDVAQAMVQRTGIELTVIDVGWPAAAAIAWGTIVGALTIPIDFVINLIMLALGLTKTMDIDFWNYWHFAFTGSLVTMATDSVPLGLIASAINAIIVFKLGDWTAEGVQEMLGIPGISLPHGFSAAYVPIGIPIKKLIDAIPPLRDVKADPEAIRERLGVLGEPMVIGFIIGILLAIAAGQDIAGILNTGVTLAGVMYLMPKVVAILMEGLVPISEAGKKILEEKYGGREMYIGLDSAIAIGHPTAIAAALILVPITIGLAFILPGNKFLPLADLAVLPFMVCMLVPIVKGNVVHTVIIGAIVLIPAMYIGTFLAPYVTQAAITAGFEAPEGATLISSICDGTNPLTFVLFLPFYLLFGKK